MTGSVLVEAAELAARGEPFVLATVVWRRAPSSGQIGSKAMVLPDGSMRGWLGGACAPPAVRREAVTALADGRPRLLLLGVPAEVADAFGDGVEVIPMACGSEGALAVYLEPVVPAPLVVAVGDSPAVSTLAGLARELGWRVATASGADDFDADAVDAGPAAGRAGTGGCAVRAFPARLRARAGLIRPGPLPPPSPRVVGFLCCRRVACRGPPPLALAGRAPSTALLAGHLGYSCPDFGPLHARATLQGGQHPLALNALRLVVGPTAEPPIEAGGAIGEEELDSDDDPPGGWKDEQAPGHYRVARREDVRCRDSVQSPTPIVSESSAKLPTCSSTKRSNSSPNSPRGRSPLSSRIFRHSRDASSCCSAATQNS